MRQTVALVALAIALGLPAAARSQTSVAVLGFEPMEVPDEVAAQVTVALKQRASETKGVKVIGGKSLVELKLTFGCLDEATGCMQQIGQSLGADKLLYGAVRKSRGGGYAVTVKYFDVARGRIENEQTFQLVKSDANAAAIKAAADHWFGAVTGLKSSAALRISASVADATIYVDDKPAGTSSGFAPVVVSELGPGRHTVRVERKGFKPYSETVTVAAGDTVDVNAQLEKEVDLGAISPSGPSGPLAPTGPTTTPTESPNTASRIAFWSTAGAAVVTVAVAGFAAWKVSDLGSQKTKAMRTACAANPNDPACLSYTPNSYCDTHPTDAACSNYVPGNDACAAANKINPVTGKARNATVGGLCSDGKSWATATWVLFPIAGAFAVASGYFFWNGYLRGAPSERPERAGSLVRRLSLSPIVGPGVAAMAAELRF
jgi:TolB-like protein